VRFPFVSHRFSSEEYFSSDEGKEPRWCTLLDKKALRKMIPKQSEEVWAAAVFDRAAQIQIADTILLKTPLRF
jgi:hypothetical protein